MAKKSSPLYFGFAGHCLLLLVKCVVEPQCLQLVRFVLFFLPRASRSANASDCSWRPESRLSCTKGTYSFATNFAKQSGHLIPLLFGPKGELYSTFSPHSVHLATTLLKPHGGHAARFAFLSVDSARFALSVGSARFALSADSASASASAVLASLSDIWLSSSLSGS